MTAAQSLIVLTWRHHLYHLTVYETWFVNVRVWIFSWELKPPMLVRKFIYIVSLFNILLHFLISTSNQLAFCDLFSVDFLLYMENEKMK